MKEFACVVLAAGKGKRMKSRNAKVLHPLCGKPMLYYVLGVAKALEPYKAIVVVGKQKRKVMEEFGDWKLSFVEQPELLGTGDAVKRTESFVEDIDGAIVVLAGDTPLLRESTIKRMLKFHFKQNADLTLLTTILEEPKGYGRIVRQGDRITEIVEEKDATSKQKEIKEINAGVYIFDKKKLFSNLREIRPKNKQQEYYLTDVVKLMQKKNGKIESIRTPDWEETIGVNDRRTLALVTDILEEKLRNHHMENGVSFYLPSTTFIDFGVKLGKDTVIKQCVSITGSTRIGKNCRINSFASIQNCTVGDNVVIGSHSLLQNEIVRKNTKIPAFSNFHNGKTER